MVGWAPSLSQSAIHQTLKILFEPASPDLLLTSHAWEMREGHRPQVAGSIWLDFQEEQKNAPILQTAGKTHTLLLHFGQSQTLQKTSTPIPCKGEIW